MPKKKKWKIKFGRIDSRGSISSTFYVQLLRLQIPKALKDTYDLTVFFTLLGSTSVKAVRRTLMKLTPDYFIN